MRHYEKALIEGKGKKERKRYTAETIEQELSEKEMREAKENDGLATIINGRFSRALKVRNSRKKSFMRAIRQRIAKNLWYRQQRKCCDRNSGGETKR